MYDFYLSIRLRNVGRIQFIANSSYMEKFKKNVAPQALDLLEKFSLSLLNNFHCKHILIKFKKKTHEKLVKNITGYRLYCDVTIALQSISEYHKKHQSNETWKTITHLYHQYDAIECQI